MRLLSILVRILIFLLVLFFALANTQPVVLTLVPGVESLRFEAPMVLWLLGVFGLGILVSFVMLLPTLVRGWRKDSNDRN